jgi:hypothetical protein
LLGRITDDRPAFEKRTMKDMRAESGVEPIIIGHRVTSPRNARPALCKRRYRQPLLLFWADRPSSSETPSRAFYPDSRGDGEQRLRQLLAENAANRTFARGIVPRAESGPQRGSSPPRGQRS